jgi:hypothetical protein
MDGTKLAVTPRKTHKTLTFGNAVIKIPKGIMDPYRKDKRTKTIRTEANFYQHADGILVKLDFIK